MKTKTIETYAFAELDEKAKQRAVSKFYDINVDFDWWEYTYEDAASIGLEILSFDDYDIKAKFTCHGERVANEILKSHGETCETYKTAKTFLELLEKSFPERDIYDESIEELEETFLNELSQDYYTILKKGYDYLTSEEAIIETIEANEYDFDIDGNLI